MEELMAEIAARLKARGRLLVAIDGRCGCGKSSLAALLARRFDANVFHMDDFYLPFAARGENWREIPAGNMDLRRFRSEVLSPLAAGETVLYRAYDCAHDRYLPTRALPFRSLSLVEGSYSLHPELAGFYDYRLFVTAEKHAQTARLKAREGDRFAAFESTWIPLEEAYFQRFGIEELADRVIRTDREIDFGNSK